MQAVVKVGAALKRAVLMASFAALGSLLVRLAHEGEWGKLVDFAIGWAVAFILFLAGTWIVEARRRRLPGPKA